jgi:hypothetical protein
VIVANDRNIASYVVLLNYTGAGKLRKPNKISVFRRNGDVLYSGSTSFIANAVKDSCAAIAKDRTS